ncbi:MAG TPA: glycosyltransferase family A protein [Capsulimonadaceae bacterium]|nr:glycosyltransferase family A protein [Capsulimonadaceae bacterium]
MVIPTYNRRESLMVTLGGLSRQTFPRERFEVVVVSDGCSDGTHEALAEFVKQSPFTIRWFCQQNAGPAAARNRGIREAAHEVIVFLDDDMEPVPEFLARHAGHHEDDLKVAVLGPMSPDPKRRAVEPVWIAWEHEKLQEIYRMLSPGGEYHGQAWSHHFYSGNASVRKEWLLAVGGFDESYKRQEDVQLAERMERELGVHFVFDPTTDGLHRPLRSFSSWLHVPASYGEWDAERIRTGLLTWETVQDLASRRNRGTRLLTAAALAFPPTITLAALALRAGAVCLNRLGARGPALSALSALYNATYMCAITRARRSPGANRPAREVKQTP